MDQNLPPEYQAELQRLQRQRQLAELMQRQSIGALSQSPGAAPGGIVPKRSWLEIAAHLGSAGLNNYSMSQADQGIQGVQQRYSEDTSKGVQGLMTQAQTDPTGAINSGLSSSNPRIRSIAEALQKRRAEAAMAAGKVIGDAGDTQGAIKVFQNGEIPAQYQAPMPPAPEFGTSPNGAGYVTTRNRKGEAEVKFEPKGVNINNNMPGGEQEKAAEKALGAEVPKIFEAARKEYMAANDQRESGQRIVKLLEDPNIITGFASDKQVGLASLGAALGYKNDSLPQTQKLISELAKQTLAAVKLLPGAITEKERPFLETAAAGQLDYSPEAIRHLAGLAIATGHNRMLNSVQQYNGAAGTPGAGTGAQMFPLPPLGEYQLDEKLFPETSRGRVTYAGQLNTPAAQVAPAPGQNRALTPAEMAEYERLKKRFAK
jgi:hypothetical protein